jgi:signal peptidase I
LRWRLLLAARSARSNTTAESAENRRNPAAVRMSVQEKVSKAMVEEAVRSFGQVRLRVLGTSMTPSVLPGDLISVQRAELHEISTGEIVLFSRDERLFVHRAVSSATEGRARCLTTRGDRLGYNDPPVRASELLGRVVSIERGRQIFHPDNDVRGWKRLILGVLRASDLATRGYLRLAGMSRSGLPALKIPKNSRRMPAVSVERS